MNTVLAHGCFDLLHLGHIKHLQEAKKLGDRLVVSVTDDKHVSKGIGRPHFTAEQRAAALRALACVDDVVINDAADATPIIAKIRPSVYVKGVDYIGNDDLALAREKEAVERVGGSLVFTDSEKFSSSRLINSERFPYETIKYLDHARHAGFRDKILKAFDAADKLKVGFVGETIVDEYVYVQGLGKASKEMMLAVVETGSEKFEGGTMAACKHAEWSGMEWVSPLGYIKKTRYVDKDFNRKILDVYSRQKIEISDVQRDSFRSQLMAAVGDCDVIIVMDFGHGLMGSVERKIVDKAKFLAVNAQSNAGNYGFNPVTKYRGANFVCVDEPEARLAAGMQDDNIDRVLNHLRNNMACTKFLVTHGKFGSMWMHSGGLCGTASAFSSGGVDTMGAGDAVMAVTAPLVASGLSVEMAAFVGNITGAIKTSIVGHRRHVNRQEILNTVEALLA